MGNEICTVNIREGILNATSTCEKAKSSIISSSAHDNSETLYELYGRNNFPWPRSRRWCNYVAKFSFRKEKFEQTRCWILLYLLSIKPYRCQRVLLSVSGWLYDITGTYDLSFYLAGFFIALSGVLLLAMPLISLYRKCLNGSRKEEADKDFANMNRV